MLKKSRSEFIAMVNDKYDPSMQPRLIEEVNSLAQECLDLRREKHELVERLARMSKANEEMQTKLDDYLAGRRKVNRSQ